MTYSIFCLRQPKIIKKHFPGNYIHSELEEILQTFQDLHRNLTTFQGKMEFKDFSKTFLKIQVFFKTV